MSMHEGAAWAGGMPPDDHELWAAAGDGDRDAFTALYHRHADAVWRQAYRLTGSRTAAEDVLAAPPGVTRVEIAAAGGSGVRHDCTILDGLAMCTINDDGPLSDPDGQDVVVTVFSTTDPQRFVV